MANHREANVIFVDTSAAFPEIKDIVGIKYIGAGGSSITIKGAADSSGSNLYFENSTGNVFDEIKIRDQEGIYVTVAGTASCYIYTRVGSS